MREGPVGGSQLHFVWDDIVGIVAGAEASEADHLGVQGVRLPRHHCLQHHTACFKMACLEAPVCLQTGRVPRTEHTPDALSNIGSVLVLCSPPASADALQKQPTLCAMMPVWQQPGVPQLPRQCRALQAVLAENT